MADPLFANAIEVLVGADKNVPIRDGWRGVARFAERIGGDHFELVAIRGKDQGRAILIGEVPATFDINNRTPVRPFPGPLFPE